MGQPLDRFKTPRSLAAIGVFIIALYARLAFIVYQGPILTGDSHDYIHIAQTLAVNGVFSGAGAPPFEPTIRRAPGYPAVLALLVLSHVFSTDIVASLQSILDAVVAAAIVVLASRRARLGWAAAG